MFYIIILCYKAAGITIIPFYWSIKVEQFAWRSYTKSEEKLDWSLLCSDRLIWIETFSYERRRKWEPGNKQNPRILEAETDKLPSQGYGNSKQLLGQGRILWPAQCPGGDSMACKDLWGCSFLGASLMLRWVFLWCGCLWVAQATVRNTDQLIASLDSTLVSTFVGSPSVVNKHLFQVSQKKLSHKTQSQDSLTTTLAPQ